MNKKCLQQNDIKFRRQVYPWLRAKLTDDIVIFVETNKAGEILKVMVSGQDLIGSEGIYHQSDAMDVMSVETFADGRFTVHVHADGVKLWECDTHVLRKKTICNQEQGTFALDDLTYTPDP